MNKTLFNNLSIRYKVLLAVSSTSLIILLLATALWCYNDWRLSQRTSKDNLHVLADVIGANVSAALNFRNQEDAAATLSALRAKPEVTSAVAYDPEGNLFASFVRQDLPDTWNAPETLTELSKQQREGLEWFEKVYSGNDFIGTVYVHSTFAEVEARLIEQTKLALSILCAAIILAILFALVVNRLISGPILALLATIQEVGKEHSFNLRAEKFGNDEVGELVDGFNEMLQQVESRDQQLASYREELEEEVKERTEELQQAFEALTENEERVRSIVDNAADGIMIFDAQGNIVSTNQAVCDMFNYSTSELKGSNFSILSNETHSARTGVQITEHLLCRARTTPVIAREFEGRTKNNKLFPVELTITRYTVGEKEFFSAILRDITLRKEAEEQLIMAKEQAEALAQTKSEFLANMSHEIRTPLNGIFGAVQLVAKTQLDDMQKEFVDILKTSSKGLLRIVNDVLEFSKLDAGKLSIEEVEFCLEDAIEGTLAPVRIEAESKGVHFTIAIEHTIPDAIIGDSHRLGQVLINLVHNAVKFTSEGGSIDLLVNKAVSSNDSLLLHFKVVDTGIGIAAERQDSIFQAFTQADTSSTRKFGGTGLGLSIASKLVHLMGGDIWVESEEGKGSTFHFTATFGKAGTSGAISSALAMAGQEKSKPKYFKRALSILMVEDNTVNQYIGKQLLETLGYEVEIANHGEEALEILAKRTPDIILMDCQMPVMDGFTATAAIREKEHNGDIRHIPIIALTAHAVSGDRERCLNAGMDDYISKPIDEEAMIDTLEDVIDRFDLRILKN